MILSCSRRTDIPAFYSEWLMNRLRAQRVCVVNPFNPNQISRVAIGPDLVDCLVFWTKNPKPLLEHLDEIDALAYKYYFQFTITPYQKDLEAGISHKSEILETFIALSKRIGKEKVILRYDPIIITEKYDVVYHLKAFDKLCSRLHPYTEKVVISYVDAYQKHKKNYKNHGIEEVNMALINEVSSKLQGIASHYGLLIESCAEGVDLSNLGILHGKCIDGTLIEKIVGYKIINKDKKDGNREHCGCMQSIDIGQYDTCRHKCVYCYANVNFQKAERNYKGHQPLSEILIGDVDESKVNLRKGVQSLRVLDGGEQIKFQL